MAMEFSTGNWVPIKTADMTEEKFDPEHPRLARTLRTSSSLVTGYRPYPYSRRENVPGTSIPTEALNPPRAGETFVPIPVPEHLLQGNREKYRKWLLTNPPPETNSSTSYSDAAQPSYRATLSPTSSTASRIASSGKANTRAF